MGWFKVTASGSLQTPNRDLHEKKERSKLTFWEVTKMFVHVLSQLCLFILSVYSAQFQEDYSEVNGLICLVSNMTKGFGNWF